MLAFVAFLSGLDENLEDDEYELDGVVYTVDLRTSDIPSSFPTSTSGHLQCRLVTYSSAETLEDTKGYLEKTLLNNLAEENGPFAEPPVVIVFNVAAVENDEEKDLLATEGKCLADSLGCGFVDVSGTNSCPRYGSIAKVM